MTNQNGAPTPPQDDPQKENLPVSPFSEEPQKPEPPKGPNEYPQPSNGNNQYLSESDARALKNVRNLIVVANIAGPVSLFLGGVLLSGVGLVCGLLGLRTLKKLSAENTAIAEVTSKVLRSVYLGIAISGVALILNAISLWIMYPIVMEALQSGNIDSMLSGGVNAATGGGTSTWG